jgi:hypothetical protein
MRLLNAHCNQKFRWRIAEGCAFAQKRKAARKWHLPSGLSSDGSG